MPKNEMTTTNESMPAVQSEQVMALLQQGVESGLSPDGLEKLVSLQERIMDRNAKAAFTAAMGRFQRDCPPIIKRKEVKDRSGRLMYKFAPLADIIAQVGDLITECGFSYSFDTINTSSGGITKVCRVTHQDGHSETTEVFIPQTSGHNTNAAQNAGIMDQYGMRYSFIGAFGLTTADEDSDGAPQQTFKPIDAKQRAELDQLIDIAGPDMPKFLQYLGVDDLADLPSGDYGKAKAALEHKIAKRDEGIE